MPVPTADHYTDIARENYLPWDIYHCVGSIVVRHIGIIKEVKSLRNMIL